MDSRRAPHMSTSHVSHDKKEIPKIRTTGVATTEVAQVMPKGSNMTMVVAKAS